MKNEIIEEKLEAKSRRVKPLTLISGIIGILFGLLLFGFAVYLGFQLFSNFWIKDSSSAAEAVAFVFTGWIIIPLFIIICGIVVVVGCLNITAGSLAIAAATKDDKKYMAKRGLVIASIVLDFILFLGFIIFTGISVSNTSNGGNSLVSIAVTVAITLLALLSPIIKIVDLSLVSKRYHKQMSYEKEKIQYEKDHSVEDRLTKYKEMFEKGVITKDEYEQLRSKVLDINKE